MLQDRLELSERRACRVTDQRRLPTRARGATQVLIEDWRIEYNTKRPHSSLGWIAPATYAERLEAQQHAGLS